MTVPVRKRIKRSLRSVVLRALIRLLAHVPLRPALAFATLVGRAGWFVARGTRARMLAHLEIAFPERSPAEREAIGRASFLHLARVAAEIVTLPTYRPRLREFVTFAPGAEERLREAMGRRRGVLMISGHLGNWELMGQRFAADWPSTGIAKMGSDPKLDALLTAARLEGNVEVLWREAPSTPRALIRCFKQGKLIGILIDQDTKVQGVFVPFFGRPAFTPRGAADLALRFRAPVLAGRIWRRGPNSGDGHVVDVEEVPYDSDAPDREAEAVRLTADLTARIEAAIRAVPAEWVWMHERWKTRPDPAEAAQAKSVPKSVALSRD